jgi:WD40 repeat protein
VTVATSTEYRESRIFISPTSPPHVLPGLIDVLHVLPISSLLLILSSSATPKDHDIDVRTLDGQGNVEMVGKLQGHMDWIRGFDSTPYTSGETLLASSSADHRVRLWNFRWGLRTRGEGRREENDSIISHAHITNNLTLVAFAPRFASFLSSQPPSPL